MSFVFLLPSSIGGNFWKDYPQILDFDLTGSLQDRVLYPPTAHLRLVRRMDPCLFIGGGRRLNRALTKFSSAKKTF